MKRQHQILITGIGGPAGKSAAAYFRSRGYFVIGADVRDVDVEADRFIRTPMAADEGFTAFLLDIIRRQHPSLFVPTVTEELLKASMLKEQAQALGCEVFISGPEAVMIANDKWKTARFMEEAGLAVPRTFEGSFPRQAVIKELGFPMLSKPCFGRGGRGVAVYDRAEEVESETREGIIFQEFIPGREYDVNLFIGRDGVVEASAALEKTAMKQGIIGNALSVEKADKKDVIELAVKASRLLGMEGPLDFDVRLRENGEPVLLEINARLGGNSLKAVEILEALEKTWRRIG